MDFKEDVSGSIKNIPISKILVGERQRQDYGDIISLQLSIEYKGLQYPIIVQPEGENFKLLAGGRRLQAFKNLKRSEIPAIFRENLSQVDQKELELEENLQRKQLNYLEEAQAIAELDRLKREKYGSNLPGRFSNKAGWSQKDTAKALGFSEGKVSQDIQIFEAIQKHPELKDLPTRRDVLRELRRLEDGGGISTPTKNKTQQQLDSFFQKDPEAALKDILPESVDLIFLDLIPSLGEINFQKMSQKMKLCGQGYFFFPLEKLTLAQEYLKGSGFNFSERPFIWHIKGKDDYLPFYWFSKGIALPPKTISWHLSHTPDKDNIHTYAKPRELYFDLISKTSKKQDKVINLTAHDVTCIKVCLEINRYIKAFCPSSLLYDQYLLAYKEF